MMKRILIIKLFILMVYLPVSAQADKQDLKREVTLYNPYKPSLPDVRKRSFLPDVNDTSKVIPVFSYDIKTVPYNPGYNVGLIKSASLLPDPLPKLYKSYVKLGFGNYFSPLAEISITNERSKKGALGLYARHFSTNGKVKLQNDKRVFAGYMDNDASLFGKKFFRKNFLDGSLDLSQKTRYAYGYDTSIKDYNPEKKEIRLAYNNLSGRVSFESLNLDSSSFSYDFDLSYNLFHNTSEHYQHNIGITGLMSKTYKDFYVGSGAAFDYYRLPSSIWDKSKYIASVSPFIMKSNQQWSFKAGIQLLLDRNMTTSPKLHIYPEASFGFSIVPSYVKFFAGLNGKLEKNEPKKIIDENPFLIPDGRSLFTLPNTNHALIVSAGLHGNTGMDGNYIVSASYSFINDMLFYSNLVFPDSLFVPQRGNLFIPLKDDVELFRVHGEINGLINDKISYRGNTNWYRYTLTANDYAWNKPDWDAQIGLKYNLRDKIIAGLDLTATGKRRLLVSKRDYSLPQSTDYFNAPVNMNIDLSAEYNYTKILTFWLKLNNISFNRYYEWAYYPSQRFLCLVGFTYSL